MYSILMTTYHIPEYLKLCVDSILENSYYNTHQLFIHVNGYDKETIDYLDKKNIEHIVTEEIGAASAINICIDQSRCDNILFASDDNYFTKNWDYYLHKWEIELNSKFPDHVKFIGYRWCEPNFGSFSPICDAGKNIDEFNIDKINEYISKHSIHDVGEWFSTISLYPRDIITKCKFSTEFYPKGSDTDHGMKVLKYLKDNNMKFLMFSIKDCFVYHFQRIASSKSKIPQSNNAKLFKMKWNMEIRDAFNIFNEESRRSISLIRKPLSTNY